MDRYEYLQKDCAEEDDDNDYDDSVNEEKTNMHIGDGASEENMETERKKREKRKSWEDGVGSEQNGGIEIDIEVKRKERSISERCAADALKDNFLDTEIAKQIVEIYAKMNAAQRQILLHLLETALDTFTKEINEPIKGKPVGRRNIKMPRKEERKLRKYK